METGIGFGGPKQTELNHSAYVCSAELYTCITHGLITEAEVDERVSE